MMFRQGQRVRTLTKKTGQTPRIGTVRAVRGEFVDVEWEDGRMSTVTGAHLLPEKRSTTSRSR